MYILILNSFFIIGSQIIDEKKIELSEITHY